MDTIELTQEQHDIYVFIMEQSPLSANASLKNFHFDEAVTDDHIIAYARMGEEEQKAWGIIALPEISTKVFIGITDTDPELYSELIASFEAESEVNDAIGNGHIAPVDSQFFNSAGWTGVVMARVSELVDGFPDSEALNGEVYDFHLVLPITQEEMVYGRRNGGEALIKKMRHNRRDFFTFFQTPRFDPNAKAHADTSTRADIKHNTSGEQPNSARKVNTQTTIDFQGEEALIPAPPTTFTDDDLPRFEDESFSENEYVDRASAAADTSNNGVDNGVDNGANNGANNANSTDYTSVMPIQLLDEDFDDDNEELTLGSHPIRDKLSTFKFWHVSKKHQIIGETVIGTLLLVGGAFLSGRLYSGSYGILAFFTAVFSVAGLIILLSAFKDSKSLSER